jgi:hypothetical protein
MTNQKYHACPNNTAQPDACSKHLPSQTAIPPAGLLSVLLGHLSPAGVLLSPSPISLLLLWRFSNEENNKQNYITLFKNPSTLI